MKKLVKKNENKFNRLESFGGCDCKCTCARCYSDISSLKGQNSYNIDTGTTTSPNI